MKFVLVSLFVSAILPSCVTINDGYQARIKKILDERASKDYIITERQILTDLGKELGLNESDFELIDGDTNFDHSSSLYKVKKNHIEFTIHLEGDCVPLEDSIVEVEIQRMSVDFNASKSLNYNFHHKNGAANSSGK